MIPVFPWAIKNPKVSKIIGTNHHELYISEKDVINIIPEIGYIFDEPFAAQALASKEKLIEIFKQLRSSGKTIILVAHSEVEKLSWCDQIIQMGS
mgnify:CR=1 FL=1